MNKPSFKRIAFAVCIAFLGVVPAGALTAALPSQPIGLPAYGSTPQPVEQAAISPRVLADTQGGASTSFLVVLREQTDLSPAAALPTRLEKGRFVVGALRETALRTQAALRAELDQAGIPYRSFYIVNMLELTGDRNLVQKLAARPDVARIDANPKVQGVNVQTSRWTTALPTWLLPGLDPQPAPAAPQSPEWNIQKVHAPDVWALGYTGQGVVIAGQDTGYQWDHPALKSHYRGWNGVAAAHDYNWHDAIHTGSGNPCGVNSSQPCDDYGHGTHTMGTMVGDDGVGNQVGMAPGARWIGCRNMNRGTGTPATYAECFEFFLAPYPVNGTPAQGDPSRAPDVVSNSWSCPPSEGCSVSSLQAVADTVRAAGIEVVAAAQNSGPSCSTVIDPIGIYPGVFTVGATDSSDHIASFSSRGPVTSDGSSREKPEISAPGDGVRSSIPGNTWGNSSGTSMATPHVAGLFALIWSAAPSLTGHLTATEAVITNTALHLTTSQLCGADTISSVPNNVFGWGRIDALAAVEAVRPRLGVTATSQAFSVLPGDRLTYTLAVANPSEVSANTGLVVTDVLPLSVTFAAASSGGVYSAADRIVTWHASSLGPHSELTFTLGVTVGVVPTGTQLVNAAYGARSDQITQTVGGPPAVVQVGSFPYHVYLPLVFAAFPSP